MSNLFSTKGVEELAEKSGSNQTYIYGGIYHNVIISAVRAGKSSVKGTPFIEVEMHTAEGGPEAAKSFQFYMTENASVKSLERLRYLFTKVVTFADWDAMPEVDSIDALAVNLHNLVKGGRVRMKFTAEQYLNANNELKDAARIGFGKFAEAIEKGAEQEPIADEDTLLTYDKDNKWDYVKLPVTADTEAGNNIAEEDPFA